MVMRVIREERSRRWIGMERKKGREDTAMWIRIVRSWRKRSLITRRCKRRKQREREEWEREKEEHWRRKNKVKKNCCWTAPRLSFLGNLCSCGLHNVYNCAQNFSKFRHDRSSSSDV
jgi:hypothetical protein